MQRIWTKIPAADLARSTAFYPPAAQAPPSDLDPAKGLALAAGVGLACWGMLGWLLWWLL